HVDGNHKFHVYIGNSGSGRLSAHLGCGPSITGSPVTDRTTANATPPIAAAAKSILGVHMGLSAFDGVMVTCRGAQGKQRGMEETGMLRPRLQAAAHEASMKIIDMTHVMNIHTPGWVGYAGNKMYYAQNLQTRMIVAQRIDTALHVGTHF